MVKTKLIRAASRGHLNFGWLDTYHTFSFGEYFDSTRMHFGALRVVNDDRIAPGGAFPLHPHENMEIISLLLAGEIEHQDSLGNRSTVRAGEVQVMSAGTGIRHSERNPSDSSELNLFQIWIYPKQKDVSPRYSQRSFSNETLQANGWQRLVSPIEGADTLAINQDAYLSIGDFAPAARTYAYELNSVENGLFLMLISGSIIINQQTLFSRDAICLEAAGSRIEFSIQEKTKLLAIEIPLQFKL